MTKRSAGILLYRQCHGQPEVLLVHPGGPFWAKKDDGAWSIPKGEFHDGETPLDVALREFNEETGFTASPPYMELTPCKQPSGKVISAWACEGDCDATQARSNLFEMEWPPRSGKKRSFPEADRADWFTIEDAKAKLLPGQVPFLTQLQELLRDQNSPGQLSSSA